MRQGCSGNRSRGGQARKPAKNEASRIEGCEIRDLSRVEMRLASAPLAVKSRFSRGFWISTLIRYHYPGRERLPGGVRRLAGVAGWRATGRERSCRSDSATAFSPGAWPVAPSPPVVPCSATPHTVEPGLHSGTSRRDSAGRGRDETVADKRSAHDAADGASRHP